MASQVSHIGSCSPFGKHSGLPADFLFVYSELSQAPWAWALLLSRGDAQKQIQEEGWAPSRQGEQVYNHPGVSALGNYS
jgi:hypothetical protein